MPATLTTAPFGASDPVRTAMPPWGWMGSVDRWTDLAVGGGRVERGEVLGDGPAGDGQAVAVERARRRAAPRITTGTPPIRSRSTMWKRPWGFVSARWGTRAAIRLKSSSSSSTRASLAIASRWRTALVEPPSAITTAIAFSNACLGHDLAGADPPLEQPDDRPPLEA